VTKKILVVFPTTTEAKLFSHAQASVEICGVGVAAAAYRTGKIIADHKPDWLILAGIAGVYEHSSFSVGDVVLVKSETQADLGFFTPAGFTHLADLALDMDFEREKTLVCPYVDFISSFPRAQSNSLSAAMAPFVAVDGVDIENMEGSAFFQVCLAQKQAFLELRSISNRVAIGDDDWDMEGAISALTAGLHQLIDELLRLEKLP
jgi:futalosine hydrolase